MWWWAEVSAVDQRHQPRLGARGVDGCLLGGRSAAIFGRSCEQLALILHVLSVRVLGYSGQLVEIEAVPLARATSSAS